MTENKEILMTEDTETLSINELYALYTANRKSCAELDSKIYSLTKTRNAQEATGNRILDVCIGKFLAEKGLDGMVENINTGERGKLIPSGKGKSDPISFYPVKKDGTLSKKPRHIFYSLCGITVEKAFEDLSETLEEAYRPVKNK